MPTPELDASVTLPRGLEPADASGLAQQLLRRLDAATSATARAAEVPASYALPANVLASGRRLRAAADALLAASTRRITGEAPRADPDPQVVANLASDADWRVLFLLLTAWSQFRGDGATPDGGDVHELRQLLFPNGLRFINAAPRTQWVEMVARMPLLERAEHRALLHALGLDRLLASLGRSHAEFGRAYGFTAATESSDAPTSVRVEFSDLLVALRDYLSKVATSVDPDIAHSDQVARYLGEPFAQLLLEFANRPRSAPRTPATPPTPPTPPTA